MGKDKLAGSLSDTTGINNIVEKHTAKNGPGTVSSRSTHVISPISIQGSSYKLVYL